MFLRALSFRFHLIFQASGSMGVVSLIDKGAVGFKEFLYDRAEAAGSGRPVTKRRDKSKVHRSPMLSQNA